MSESILKLPEVMKRTALSRSTVYGLISRNKFPKQIKLGERSTGWVESEITEWIDSRISESRYQNEQVKPLDMSGDDIAFADAVTTYFEGEDK